MEWVLNIALFLLGYVTCKAFYFLNASRISINMLKGAQLTCLLMLARSMEHFSYSRALRLHHMKTAESSQHNIQAFTYRFEEELIHYKKRSIEEIINAHPGPFERCVEFDSWRSGMKYLEENKDLLELIRLRSTND
jgi:hypothetical protein|tara:strand:- start:151 stop:558 length:408 start_codon:yes stop_codon:yes gene_type:complete